MARGKKKVELSLEAKLEQALVPVDEQPYEVPENWCWVRWGTIGEFVAGNGFKKEYQGFTGYEIPFYKVGSLKYADDFGYLYDESNTITEEIRMKLKATLIPRNSILFAKIGEAIRLNRRCLNKKECCIDNNTIAFLTHSCNFRYVYYWTLGQEFYNLTNATTVPAIRKSDLELIKIPLPPLAEQQRIVERIEYLFAKLNEVTEKVQDTLVNYEIRRSVILQKAISGELTKGWRLSHGILRTDWKVISLKDCGTWFGGGTPTTSKSEYWDGGTIPWITSKDMKEKMIEDSLLHITQEGVNNSSANYCDKPAVLFVMRSGILRRVFPVCMVKMPFTVNQDLKAVIPEKIQQEYMYWACIAYEKDIRDNCMKSGTTVESIEAKKLFRYEIPLPTEEEQKVIVGVVEKLIGKETAAKEAAEMVLEKVALIKKAILAKAFRGELGTNNPDEERSIELLKQILGGRDRGK